MSLVRKMNGNRFPASAALAALAALLAVPARSWAVEGLDIHGVGWTSYGSIVKSADTVGGLRPEGRALLNTGAAFAMTLNPTEKLRIEAGIGAVAAHFLAANPVNEGGYAPMEVGPFVSNANFRYAFWDGEGGALAFRGGLFPYDYNKHSHNLGLYLLRGPVYPGYLLSGFETKHVLPVANNFGFQLHHRMGGFSQDLLFTFETEFFPYWDMSPAYVAAFENQAFRVAAGVNFYHLLPADPGITYRFKQYVDEAAPAGPESTYVAFNGTKVMAMAAFDLKALWGGTGGEGMFGAEDLKIYGEAALIGLDNSEVHKKLYGGYGNRMPIMFGINLPAFKFLDRLSFEVQQHKAKFKDDFTSFNNYNDPSPIPFGPLDTAFTADDIKWSLYGSKVVLNHVKISLQAASDHFRPGIFKGYGDNNTPTRQAILTRPSDWYWTGKVSYFF